MCAARENVLVVDVSVLPVRPAVGAVKEFLEKQIKIDYADVKALQLHHTRNCVLIEMVDKSVALRYQMEHNCKRTIVAANQEFKIPVYVDGDAVTVRINDLPATVSNTVVAEFMLKFGEVISIRNETWRHYFPGIPNGVRVLRMNLIRNIPSNLTIGNEDTTVSYINQPISCRRCNNPAHPNRKCADLSGITDSVTVSPSPNSPSLNEQFTRDNFPPLSSEQSSPPRESKPAVVKQKPQNDDEWTDVDDNGSTSSDYIEVTNKRRRSTRKANEPKKLCANQCSPNAGHGETIGAALKENVYVKNKNQKCGSSTVNSKK